jgi:vancomycin permeability regulator SanA
VAGLSAGAAGSTCRLKATPAQDQAAPSDAIGVFGAAEYDGRPSPVYRARLDHALELYHRGIAPLIITLGGNGGDQYTEGAVGREYLMAKGVRSKPSSPKPRAATPRSRPAASP